MTKPRDVQKEIKEIADLFSAAYRYLTMAKCRVTAMATFNRAQTLLDALEKDPDPEVVRGVKEARAATRAAVGKSRSLHRILGVYAQHWSQSG